MSQNFLWLPELKILINCDRIDAIEVLFNKSGSPVYYLYMDVPEGLHFENDDTLVCSSHLVLMNADAHSLEKWMKQFKSL